MGREGDYQVGTEGEEEKEMSVFRWRYDETCEGRYCCGDCDKCDKEDEEDECSD
jgi:hypothetical protein